MSSEECGPNATQEDWPNELDWMVSTLDSFDKTFRPRLEASRCGGDPDVARVGKGGMSQHRFKETGFAYGSQSW